MVNRVQKKVLAILADGKAHFTSDVLAETGCSAHSLTELGHAGLLRCPDVNRGGLMLCITPSGIARYHLSKSGESTWSVVLDGGH